MDHVAILTGGSSSEREIALASAASVKSALEGKFTIDVYNFPADIDRFLTDRQALVAAIPVFHGKGGEDGVIQGFLETLGVPYIFSGVTAHAIGLDKALTKHLVRALGVKTADWEVLSLGQSLAYLRPVVVKPINGGSSIGVEIARSQAELEAALHDAFRFASRVLVETFIEGEEFTVAVIDHGAQPEALPIIAIRSKTAFFDYQSKYDPDLVEEICPAPIDSALAQTLQRIALQAHQAIGARHLSRSDFIVDRLGEVWFLEINTIPGQTVNSLVPKALRAAGKEFGQELAAWIASS